MPEVNALSRHKGVGQITEGERRQIERVYDPLPAIYQQLSDANLQAAGIYFLGLAVGEL